MIVAVQGWTRHGTVATTEYEAPDDPDGVEKWLDLNALDFWKITDFRICAATPEGASDEN